MARSNRCASTRLAVLHQRIRGAVELHRADGLEATPSNSPRPLRSCSQRCVARSEAGWARRPTTAPVAAVRNAPLSPTRSAGPAGPIVGPTGRPARRRRCGGGPGATSRRRPAARSARLPVPAPVCRGRPTVRLCAALRVRRRPGNRPPGALAGQDVRCGSRPAAIAPGECRSGPRLSRVRWRTALPMRSEWTRRCEK